MTTTAEPYVAHHRGLRVPWVAQWSGELRYDPVQPYLDDEGRLAIRYADETPQDRDCGALWLRTGVDRSGEPQFAKLNAQRQREAMLHGLCQVCGLPAQGSWYIPPPERRPNGRPHTTSTPPTCAACLEQAKTVCPHLRKYGGTRLRVANYRLWAIWGDIVTLRGMRPTKHQGEVQIDDDIAKRAVIGRQLTVELWDYRRLKGEPPAGSSAPASRPRARGSAPAR